jgi:hypothetical protein
VHGDVFSRRRAGGAIRVEGSRAVSKRAARAVKGEAEPVPARAAATRVARTQYGVSNQVLQSQLRPHAAMLQPKLAISPADDPAEADADRLADRAVQPGAAPIDPPKVDPPGVDPPGGGVTPRGAPHTASFPRRAGQPLAPTVRGFFGPRLGMPLASVRVHQDAETADTARNVGARAFAVGHDIGFARGEYAPETHTGRRLLAHELAHVVLHGNATEQRLRRQPAPGAASATPAPQDTPPAAVRAANDADRQVPLASLLAPGAAFQPEDPWELVFNIFRNRGSPQFAGLLIRRLIARRWYDEQGIDPSSEMVTETTTTPPGPTVLPAERVYRIRDHDLSASAGQIDLPALDEAFGTHRLQELAGEAARQAQSVGEAAQLQSQVAALAERVPQFAARIRGSFADARLAEVQAFQQFLTTTRDQAAGLATVAPAGQFVAGADAAINGHLATVTAVLGELQNWRTQHPRGVTSSEAAEQRTKESMAAQQKMMDQGNYMAAGVWGESASDDAMSLALIDLFGGRTQRDIAESYDRGEVSFNEMEDLQYCAAVRTAVVGIVTVALAVATAGIGGAIVGGLGLATEGTLAFSVLGAGVEGGLGTVGMMGTEHILTSARDFDNPSAQAIWGRGAYTPGQYLMGFGMGFGMGGALGAGGHFLFPPPGGGAMVPLGRGGLAPVGGPEAGALALPGEAGLGGAPGGAMTRVRPPYDVLSVVDDAASGVRTVRVRMADGELVSIVAHTGSGNGYMVRASGEAFSIVEGRIGGPLRSFDAPGTVPDAPGAVPETPAPQLGPGGYQPQSPDVAMNLWGDTRWESYGGNWVMRDAATGQRMQVWQIDELMAASRRGALPGETQVPYQLPGTETFSGRPSAQGEVIPDIARTGRAGPMPPEGPSFTEVKHRDFARPGLQQLNAMDAAGSLQRMYRAAGIEAQVNPASAGATLEIVTSQQLSAETKNLIVREYAQWLQQQGLGRQEIIDELAKLRWTTQRPYQIRGGTVVREP